MCGRYTLGATPADLLRELPLLEVPELWQPRFNVAPTQLAPVITSATPRVAKLSRWGLLPAWAKEVKVASQFVNARSEKLLTHSTYSELVVDHRCVVPMTGFYEWQRDASQKRPHHITPPDGPLWLAAGLWWAWRSPEGVTAETFTILTTRASQAMERLHDRMPVFLEGEARALWLSDSKDTAALAELMQPTEAIAAVEVRSKVNSVTNEGPELLKPPAASQLGLF